LGIAGSVFGSASTPEKRRLPVGTTRKAPGAATRSVSASPGTTDAPPDIFALSFAQPNGDTASPADVVGAAGGGGEGGGGGRPSSPGVPPAVPVGKKKKKSAKKKKKDKRGAGGGRKERRKERQAREQTREILPDAM
jgi:hypothetical protein